MEFFLKEHTFNQVVLQTYNDYSRKIVAQRKLNQQVIFAKANPTSKACEKFLINAQLELKVELIPLLINTLRNYVGDNGRDREDFNVVGSYENWKKEPLRLILRTGEYGGKELLIQKKVEVLQDEDMVFEDDAEPTEMNAEWKSSKNLEDQFGCFYIKKSDNVAEIVKGLNEFYANTGTTTSGGKKRKPNQSKKNKEPEIGYKKSKQAVKENKIDDLVDECKSYLDIINNDALVELAYYCDMSKLNLENCILCYHEEINNSINISERVDFLSLLREPVELKTIEDIIKQIIKKFFFVLEMVKKKVFTGFY